MSEHHLIANEQSALALPPATVGVRPRPISRTGNERRAADQRRWLAGLMLQQSATLPRFVLFYGRLQTEWFAWPRRLRRQIGRRFVAAVAGAALLLALSRAPARAATIAVADGEVGVSDNGLCSLIEAIENANDTTNGNFHDDCTAGDPAGADTITLPAGGSFTLATSLANVYDSETGLPLITAAITLSGNGATIERDTASQDKFRLLAVGSTGNLTLNQVTLRNGYAYYRRPPFDPNGQGGAVLNAGTLAINDSTISGNVAYHHGGGVFNHSGTITITNSTLDNNTSGSTGGGLSNEHGQATVTNSTLSRNQAGFLGGGVFNVDGTLTVSNSTISGNTAYEGGGVDNNTNGVVTISNSTLSSNQATVGGGGLVNVGTLTINRSLVSGNTAKYHAEVFGPGDAIVANNNNLFGHSGIDNAMAFFYFTPGANDITATSDGTAPTALTAILYPMLGSNGGPTQTHALVPGSPAIDAAPSIDCSAAPVNDVDQRGRSRNVNGAGSSSANECDVGAYELFPFAHFLPLSLRD